MAINDKYSKMYLADITVENDWGYHMEALWYGADVKNLALTIMDVMGSWYLPNKEQMSPDIVKFYDMLEAATAQVPEGSSPEVSLSFTQLTGEMFRGNGLTMTVTTTNNLLDMYKLIANETFEIFATKGEKMESFENLTALIDYMDATYEIDKQLIDALRTPDERTIISALYIIDAKYDYTQRHYRNQTLPKSSESDS